MSIIFDLDMTLINSSIADQERKNKNWSTVYRLISSFNLFDDIGHVLQTIQKNNIPFVIVTSSPKTYCQRVLQRFDIQPLNLVCYHDTKYKKPHPEPILLACQYLDVNPSNVLSFGDSAIDIQASNQAGAISIACLWGAINKNELTEAKPQFTIEKPREILSILSQHSYTV